MAAIVFKGWCKMFMYLTLRAYGISKLSDMVCLL